MRSPLRWISTALLATTVTRTLQVIKRGHLVMKLLQCVHC